MKLLSFEIGIGSDRRQHLGALVEGDADSGLVIDLTNAAHLLLLSKGSPTGVAESKAHRIRCGIHFCS